MTTRSRSVMFHALWLWHRWFAWYPVEMRTPASDAFSYAKTWVWWEWTWRKYQSKTTRDEWYQDVPGFIYRLHAPSDADQRKELEAALSKYQGRLSFGLSLGD